MMIKKFMKHRTMIENENDGMVQIGIRINISQYGDRVEYTPISMHCKSKLSSLISYPLLKCTIIGLYLLIALVMETIV